MDGRERGLSFVNILPSLCCCCLYIPMLLPHPRNKCFPLFDAVAAKRGRRCPLLLSCIPTVEGHGTMARKRPEDAGPSQLVVPVIYSSHGPCLGRGQIIMWCLLAMLAKCQCKGSVLLHDVRYLILAIYVHWSTHLVLKSKEHLFVHRKQWLLWFNRFRVYAWCTVCWHMHFLVIYAKVEPYTVHNSTLLQVCTCSNIVDLPV